MLGKSFFRFREIKALFQLRFSFSESQRSPSFDTLWSGDAYGGMLSTTWGHLESRAVCEMEQKTVEICAACVRAKSHVR
jgi:hypothetical protein